MKMLSPGAVLTTLVSIIAVLILAVDGQSIPVPLWMVAAMLIGVQVGYALSGEDDDEVD